MKSFPNPDEGRGARKVILPPQKNIDFLEHITDICKLLLLEYRIYCLGKGSEIISTSLFSAGFVWDENLPFRFKMRFIYKTLM